MHIALHIPHLSFLFWPARQSRPLARPGDALFPPSLFLRANAVRMSNPVALHPLTGSLGLRPVLFRFFPTSFLAHLAEVLSPFPFFLSSPACLYPFHL